jgi:hypothetical protein
VSDEVLLEMSRTLGRIEAKIDGTTATLTQHVEHDEKVTKALFERIEGLQLGAARQKGALKVLGVVGSALGAGVGYLIERVTLGHHQ